MVGKNNLAKRTVQALGSLYRWAFRR